MLSAASSHNIEVLSDPEECSRNSGTKMYEQDGFDVFFNKHEWVYNFYNNDGSYSARCNQDYSKVTLHGDWSNPEAKSIYDKAIRMIIECRFSYLKKLSLHSACIELNGEAFCFVGESGIGKSTRAKAWNEALGAKFISGDRPAIRVDSERAIACGVPWDGKEQIFRNVECPIRAIFEVRRAPFTVIRRLTTNQKVQMMFPQVFIPMWDTDTAALAMSNVNRLIDVVPMFRLFCGPDLQSAFDAYQVLTAHQNRIKEAVPQMKIKDGFRLRHVKDDYFVIPTGANMMTFSGTIVLNEVAAFIFENMKKWISKEDVVELIKQEYEIDEETAMNDLEELIEQMKEINILEEC